MSTNEKDDAAADLEEVIRLMVHGGVPDPELVRRVQERSAQVRKELGPTNIAVVLIREGRE